MPQLSKWRVAGRLNGLKGLKKRAALLVDADQDVAAKDHQLVSVGEKFKERPLWRGGREQERMYRVALALSRKRLLSSLSVSAALEPVRATCVKCQYRMSRFARHFLFFLISR